MSDPAASKIRSLFKPGFWKKILLGVYALSVFLAGFHLFFGEQFQLFASLFVQEKVQSTDRTLTIAYALPFRTFEPTIFNSVDRSRMVDLYEGLVKTDRNLKIQPGLALSWGLLEPTTWEFRLRAEVKFHDGKALSPEDVVFSLQRSQTFKDSQLKNLLNTIKDVKIIDNRTIHIVTRQPDPLLLNKLAVTWIVPKDFTDFSNPIGTGPYRFVSSNSDEVKLARFEAYWGNAPFYPEVVLHTISSRSERQKALEKGEVHLLADVPPAATLELASDEISLTSIPSLEVNFLMFNLTDLFLSNYEVREALAHAFDGSVFVQAANGYARPVGQFVSSGVFGFNPEMPASNFDMNRAKKLIVSFYADRVDPFVVTFDYPENLDIIGQYVEDQLNQLGIEVILNPLPDAELQKKIIQGDSQLYFLGWRSELGDSADLMLNVVHSRDSKGLYGQFNGTYYYNSKVDKAIEESLKTLDQKARLKLLQDAMRIAVQEDIIGVPLFESEKIFAYRNSIRFTPRIDGFILASEIR